MPSQEFKQVLEFLAAQPDTSGLPFEEQRRAMDEAIAILPMAEDVSTESLKIGAMEAEWIVPKEIENDAVILYLHGGGYCIGSITSHRSLVSFIAKSAKAKALSIGYRLAPENPFPAAVEDAVAAYRWLLTEGNSARHIVIAGDSAGGGLTLATLLDLKQKGEQLPAAGVCLSPWVDLEAIGDSITSKADIDPMVTKDGLLEMTQAYLGNTDPKTPLAAPLYGDFEGLPPLLIQVGEAEILLDDANRVTERAKQVGVEVVLENWADMVHVWQFFAAMGVPESKEAIDAIGSFIQKYAGD